MSGIVGHSMYAIHAAQIADERRLAIAPVLRGHFASYLAGAYLGCDIRVMPEAVCVDTGREVGFGTVPLEESPLTGGAVRPWALVHDGQSYRPNRVLECREMIGLAEKAQLRQTLRIIAEESVNLFEKVLSLAPR